MSGSVDRSFNWTSVFEYMIIWVSI